MGTFLGAGGRLSRLDSGFEERPGQLAMAEAVASILDTGGALLAEAGTGTGKTLAYLLPAAASGRRTVVSTATRNLQDQILNKDLPLVERLLGRPVHAVALKGRSNYVCVWRLTQVRQADAAELRGDRAHWTRIDAWSEHTETGDRADVPGVPEDAAVWADLTATAESCLGGRCPRHADCHVTRARSAAQAADLVIANHHLYFSDLAIREAGGEVLPAHAFVVFDEAHAVPDTAAEFFGRRISNRQILDWERDLRRALAAQPHAPAAVSLALEAVAPACEHLFRQVAPDGAGRAPWRAGEQDAELERAWHALDTALDGVPLALRAEPGTDDDLVAFSRRAGAFRNTLAAFFEPGTPGWVQFVEARRQHVALSEQPVEPADAIREPLLAGVEAAVFTSATLTVGGDFGYIRERIGLDTDTVEARFDSPFDFARQARLYVPADLPAPNDPRFPAAVADEAATLCELTGGRAFLLFTSYRNLHAVYDLLAPRLSFPVLRQGDAPRARLLDQFRCTPGAVLFATSSFWEGVDVAGEALSLVVIDKLPFESPADPVLQARIAARREAGGNPFMELQVPAAALALKQGFGRLIRTATDRGIVALLDARVRGRPYGRVLLRSLPPAPLVAELDTLAAWWLAEP